MSVVHTRMSSIMLLPKSAKVAWGLTPAWLIRLLGSPNRFMPNMAYTKRRRNKRLPTLKIAGRELSSVLNSVRRPLQARSRKAHHCTIQCYHSMVVV